MDEDIAQFRDYYADRFATGMAEFLNLHGLDFFQQLRESLKRNRSVIYLLGNGGSHAIAECLKYALQSYAAEHQLPVRIQTGVDVHQVASDPEHDPGISFTQLLHSQGADAEDLVVLISGSGDSDNLSATARYASERGIPTLALLGSRGCKISKILPAERCFCSPFDDQQISEDVIQSLAYFFDLADQVGPVPDWSNIVSRRAEKLKRTIEDIPAHLLDRIADLVVEAFDRGQVVWVVGLDHPALSASAEHTAHNLYWDSIYEVARPPRRLVVSSPTACNFSGISNDRRRGVFRNLTDIHETQGGVALIYAMSSGTPAADDLLDQLDRSGTPACFFSGEILNVGTRENIATYCTSVPTPQMQAGLSQIFGHMLGRIVRLKLLERERSRSAHPIEYPAQFLIDFDLAQRRLLDD